MVRKADTSATDSDTKMWQNMALVGYNGGGSSPSHGDEDNDFEPMSKADTPASDSRWWHKVPLVLYDGSSSRPGDDDDDDFEPMDDELAIFARHVESYVPLTIVRPESLENGPEKWPWPVLRYTGETYKRRRGRPAGPKSSKSNIEQKPPLSDSNSGKSNHSKGEKDGDFEPPTPTRKRGRSRGSKSAKRKTEQKSVLVDSSSTSSGEGMTYSDDDYEPERKKKKNIKKPGRRRRSKPSSDNIDNEEAACGPDTDDFAAINFKIVVGDGLVIGRRMLPDHIRRAYYHLCQARKVVLHRHLLKQISPMLAAGMIEETANIDEGIRASSSKSLNDLVSWKKTLEFLETLGMDVAFMRKRVDDLLHLLDAPSSTMGDSKRYEEVKLEQARADKKMRDLELSLRVLQNFLKEVDVEMEQMLEASAKKKKYQAVRTLATVPW